jgi:murein DD-endopeptidase MepM/ murein hydrolase activator NlpD
MRLAALGLAAVVSFTGSARAQTRTVSVEQGGLARWTGAAAKECGFRGKRYPAVDAACYYPVDVRALPGNHAAVLYDQDGKAHEATLKVTKRECAEVPLRIENAALVKLSAADEARHAQEREKMLEALAPDPRAAGFSLPLRLPAADLNGDGEGFCETRVLNDEVRTRHTGRDYRIARGTTVRAPADGVVVLAGEYLLAGNAVVLDHGGGLATMFFHLDEIAAKAGQTVKRGDALGKVGETGRATGPHLHWGARWANARIDPALLIGEPAKLPDLGAATGQ